MTEAATAETTPMKTFTSAPTETAAAKPASAVESAAAAKTPGVSPIEEEWGPHQSCGRNGRYKELGT
jgi:hypothetical protein